MQIHFVAVKVSIERRANTLVESERTVRLHARIERHDAEFMQARLTIEQHNVVVDQVTLDHVAVLELLGYLVTIAELEESFGVAATLKEKVRARVNVRAVYDQLAHELDVGFVHAFRIRQNLGHVYRNGDLIDAEVRIGRDDRSTAKVYSLAAQVASEATLFAFQTLAKTPGELFWLLKKIQNTVIMD
jgi:hypothetical protein